MISRRELKRRTESYSTDRFDGLIARCLSGRADEAAGAIARDGLWEYVVLRACETGVGALLLRALDEQGASVPCGARMQLEAFREHVAAEAAYTLPRVRRALAALQDAGVPLLLLKGAALQVAMYAAPGLRPMVDADVLIRVEDAGRADRALRVAGCRPGAELLREDFYPRYYYEREYFTPDEPLVKIDLHVRPLRPLRFARRLPEDALWNDTRTVDFGGMAVSIPNPVNMLIHLAAHAACHGTGMLKWWFDIYAWYNHYKELIQADELRARCRAWSLGWPARSGLLYAAHLFNDRDLLELADALSGGSGLRDRLALWHAPRDVDHPAAALAVNLLCTPGWCFRAGYLAAVLLPDRAHLAQVYGRRHPGWPIVAHLVRGFRGLARLFPAAPIEAA
jgi:hypothetical protein